MAWSVNKQLRLRIVGFVVSRAQWEPAWRNRVKMKEDDFSPGQSISPRISQSPALKASSSSNTFLLAQGPTIKMEGSNVTSGQVTKQVFSQ